MNHVRWPRVSTASTISMPDSSVISLIRPIMFLVSPSGGLIDCGRGGSFGPGNRQSSKPPLSGDLLQGGNFRRTPALIDSQNLQE